jgi:hypothetical protein
MKTIFLQPLPLVRNHRLNMFSSPALTRTALFCAFASLFAPAFAASAVPGSDSASSSVAATLPDAPQPQTVKPTKVSSPESPNLEGHQTKRILGIVPNFRAVSVDEKLPPESVKEKFIGTAEDSFDYSAIIFAAGQAGVAQAQDSYPEFHQGAAGYGRYFWHTFADQTSENFFVQAILPTALHQDSRYYTKGRGGLVKRSAYSFSRILITRQDDGSAAPNYSEVIGAGASSGLSALYYPSVYETWTKVGQRWLTNVIIDGATLTFREFWPDLNNSVFHQK